MAGPIPLKLREFRGCEPGPHLLITGGVHGDEFEPIEAIRRLILRFQQPEPRLTRGRLTLVPVVNEPAYLRGTRTGDDALDLARVCPGRAEGSVTEQIAHSLSQLIRTADYYIDLHSGGAAYSVWPLAGYVLHPDESVRRAQREMALAFNLPVVWGTSAELNGRSLSVARDAGVPAIYAEYLGAGGCDPRGVAAYEYGCLNVMDLLGMIDRPTPTSLVEHLVEDDRPQSGHLQVCYPSPITGLFQPVCRLGGGIARGDLIGEVNDPLGGAAEPIHAEQAGMVLVLRSFPRVRQGESVAVILETDADQLGKASSP